MPDPLPGPDAAMHARRAERAARERRAQALTEWRRVDLRPAEQAARKGDRTLGDILPKVLEKLGFDHRLTETQIRQVWAQTVDPRVAAHAQPMGLRNGTLFVVVDSNLWLSEIVRYHRHELLERLRHAVGGEKLAKISFRLG
jgi:predicted nucleic acid-binding Zn ribbon protein